ncbi:MAG TPA: VOC family protein [Solirubrobacteraceae bacterium]|jgi:catechol 2,3-dioxygenase|nr:VOC family protein [Solirubrobacteraceae bacterium]
MTAIDPNLRISSVQLDVSDLPRGIDFYEGTLGLPLISRDEHHAWLGPNPLHPALVLGDIVAPTLLPPGATGLYHVAWLHPTRAALAETVRRVAGSRWPFEGASDHGVSEALYLSDPDGLGIEIYVDRPREQWQRPPSGHGVKMVTLPLDLDDLLAQSTAEPAPVMAPQTGIGHVHLKVADVPRTAAFYRDALGLDEQAQLPSAAFLAAGGYHHHVGANSWQSRGAGPAPDSAPGLRRVEFELSDVDALDALERTLADAPDPQSSFAAERDSTEELSVRDPDGQLLSFVAT